SKVGKFDEIVPADIMLDREVPLTRVCGPVSAVEERDRGALGQAGSIRTAYSARGSRWKNIDAQRVRGHRVGQVVCETLARPDRRWRYLRKCHKNPRKFGVVHARANPYHRVTAEARLPGETQTGRKIVPVRPHDLRADLPQARVCDQARPEIEGMHQIPCPAL